ncbi:amidase [uncultured Jannaschia sp.]|uniref:amidase n=1 Tax=uncultured Jannaschia sp. TaxID=293347 RepID=UPI002626642D|nr:amidase [uncultured Jannaschia sp.]
MAARARHVPDSAALLALGAVELRDRLASGALSAIDLTEACIARIEAREPDLHAWAFFDAEFAREQARRLDAHRTAGRPIGALHGLPIGLKDIIDTAKIPTANGAPMDAGRVPTRDAYVIERLKQAGAVLMGKTHTTELAFMDPSPSRNPHDPSRTPGGSSAGSAVAVADAMVPLAIGTQTGGSIIRPASFCGVTGFKPSFGTIPRRGILMQSPSLDTPGVFAADVTGAALLAEALMGHDATDRHTIPGPVPHLLDMARADAPVAPTFAFLRPPGWDAADPELHAAFAELVEALGDRVFEVELPDVFAEAAPARRRINLAEMSRHYDRYWRLGGDTLGPEIRAAIEEGRGIAARDYLAACDWPDVLYAALAEIFARCDAILCPAAPGPAPGHETTGDPVFNGLWTLTGTPAVTLPLLVSGSGLPMGVQLTGPRGDDGRLLRTARWLETWADTEG